MLARYEVVGEVASLILTKRGCKEEFITKISVEDLSKVLLSGAKWYVNNTNKTGGIRVWGYFKDDLDKYKLLYRFILGVENSMTVDHINNDSMDNRRCNLRIITQAENNQNWGKLRSNNTTGIRGVGYFPRDDNYLARISIDGVYKHLGYFDTKEEAEAAVIENKKKHQPFSKEAIV